MPNRKPRERQPAPTAIQQFEWFKSAGSHAGSCDKWEVKTEPFTEMVLGLLSTGVAVMFGTSRDGGAISITIYDGDYKHREWVADEMALEDLVGELLNKIDARREATIGPKLRAIGD